ncbi:MAG: UDP-N-acetylmuramate dehydrogenase [Anaerolineales bacterium]
MVALSDAYSAPAGSMRRPARATAGSQLNMDAETLAHLQAALGPRLRTNERLDRYTSARIGGPADCFIVANSRADLMAAVQAAWSQHVDVFILGAGSNVLVADAGFRGLVIHNRARRVSFRDAGEFILARAEAGMSLPGLARLCIARGAAGLEWAATVPGTVGGAVVGNAGAHGSDIAASLQLAEILQREGDVRWWPARDLGLAYRWSRLKAAPGRYAVLAAEFKLARGEPETLQRNIESFQRHRRQTQPGGASIGSMFRNPPGDHAGRLVEAAGLKGTRIGAAEISTLHANFFVNRSDASATDVYSLIKLARETVRRETGIELELEVELVGDWGDEH